MEKKRNKELNNWKCPPSVYLPRVVCRKYSETKSINCQFNPFFVTGFIDGEGSFGIHVYKNVKYNTGWDIRYYLKIKLHVKDMPVLLQIKSFFGGIGNISIDKKSQGVTYQIQSIKDINSVIIPHFTKYPLITQKLADFLLFKSAVEIVNQKEHLTPQGIQKIINIKASLNKGLSGVLKSATLNTTPMARPSVEVPEIINPNWLAGFTTGEGCFYVSVTESKTNKIGFKVNLWFKLSQHSRDRLLFDSIIKYLRCGIMSDDGRRSAVYLTVTKFTDLLEKIIPLFDKYPIEGTKRLDFIEFKNVAKIVNDKSHLTSEGIKKICEIKTRMNTGRNNYF